ncbi:hypothetical protein [Kutzneria kofuensis]|uniref:Uncharacterized protein n=1 Tax=Kutzneria kofuensis TaxID=103725 RepID=A0A7W9KML7_9PSEU|nr:hypothetical protein [Kutzneria kofuensis]MBB5895350.1 hypothetical protein [Kutzneria kofuensis]
MDGQAWVRGPVGVDAAKRVTMAGCRSVLVMVPTMTAGTRLSEVVPLLEADHRIQLIYTVPGAMERWHGLDEYVHGLGAMVLPWGQAMRERYDLVLTASHREIEHVRGKVMVLPHGVGNAMSRRYSRKAGGATRATTGLDREVLTYRGRVIPSAIMLSHEAELAILRTRCPEAAHTAVVAGDICLDRMVASRRFRDGYREALGVREGECLVTISSTWGTESTFGQHFELYQRLSKQGCKVAAVLHPNITAAHGRAAVRGWLGDCIRAGLTVIPPDRGWQAAMVASDLVIGDHGSSTMYAAASGTPTIIATDPPPLWPDSPADVLMRNTPRLDHGAKLWPQLTKAMAEHSGPDAELARVITGRPGEAAAILRSTMYWLLGLAEPTRALPMNPVPVPWTS